MKTEDRYDILNRAKNRGQGALLELPRVSRKDNPKSKLSDEICRQRRAKIQEESNLYKYALAHPDLCPPVGTEFLLCNQYGIKAKVIVKMVLNGLPGTEFELLPLSEQPEHLRDRDMIAKHIRDQKLGFTCWADTRIWEMYQKQQCRQTNPWIES